MMNEQFGCVVEKSDNVCLFSAWPHLKKVVEPFFFLLLKHFSFFIFRLHIECVSISCMMDLTYGILVIILAINSGCRRHRRRRHHRGFSSLNWRKNLIRSLNKLLFLRDRFVEQFAKFGWSVGLITFIGLLGWTVCSVCSA